LRYGISSLPADRELLEAVYFQPACIIDLVGIVIALFGLVLAAYLVDIELYFSLKPADQQLSLVDHFLRQVIVKADKQLFVFDHFLAPGFAVKFL
jgi:hypothetical protein